MDGIKGLIEKHCDEIIYMRRDLHRILEPAYVSS